MVTLKRIFLVYTVSFHALLGFLFWEYNALRETYQQLKKNDRALMVKYQKIEEKSQKLEEKYQNGCIDPFSPPVEMELHYRRMLMYHKRSIRIVPDDALIIIGDSIVQGLSVTAIAPNSINYGIGTDTTFGLLQRIPVYMQALERAQAIVLIVGSNDFKFRSVHEALENYRKILSALPKHCKIVVSSVLPVDENARQKLAGRNLLIKEFNHGLKEIASAHTNVVFLDNTTYFDTDGDSFLDRKFHEGDGLHLNTKGNALLVRNIRQIITEYRDRS